MCSTKKLNNLAPQSGSIVSPGSDINQRSAKTLRDINRKVWKSTEIYLSDEIESGPLYSRLFLRDSNLLLYHVVHPCSKSVPPHPPVTACSCTEMGKAERADTTTLPKKRKG